MSWMVGMTEVSAPLTCSEAFRRLSLASACAAAAATQASAKQAANGKEDDEDWWTE